ncbi:uncharacterized protein BDV17DRAFT_152937 [Aspergillus undulatus]|uniref:uncharacterized protein n=1 Tax=Aspergillus undulatus TaxID=1810928 RepID=UPI003CCCBDBB
MKLYALAAFLPLLASAAPACQSADTSSTPAASAAPSSHPTSIPTPSPGAGADAEIIITPAQIKAFAPQSVSCFNVTQFPEECATAEDAAPAISKAFQYFGLTSKAEQAAVLGLMAFETGDFRYNKHHFPTPTAGQGTRNMQSADYNKEYALSFPALAPRVKEAGDDMEAILDIVLEDPVRDFGSGAWFLTTQCTAEQREALKSGSEEGWAGYIADCVKTGVDDRRDYWNAAKKALGI